ncbi:MAG: cell division protein FtsB [uncultured bacterium]|nr:MAG: cell division protein FtsB [uncultured bacterium]
MEFFRSNVIVSLLLLGLLVFMQYRLWCGSGGIIDMMHLKKQLAVEQARNDVLKKRNQTLLLQVEHLQQSQGAVEGRAREDLGMIKKGETFYQVVK